MLVDQHAFVARQRDVRTFLVRVGWPGRRGPEQLDEVGGLRLAQQPHRIGPAASAVQHLR